MKKYLIILALIGFTASSCAKYLDVAPPNRLTSERMEEILNGTDMTAVLAIFNGMGAAMPQYMAATAIYAQGGADGRYYTSDGINFMRNLQGNDVILGIAVSTAFGYAEYNLNDFQSEAVDKNFPYWYYAWERIHNANKLLNFLTPEYIDSKKAHATTVQYNNLREFRARALIIRARQYTYLMETYQDSYVNPDGTFSASTKLGMPLYDKWDPGQDDKARATAGETYNFIIADLAEAEKIYTEIGLTATKTTLTDLDPIVLNYVYARAALLKGDWEKVVTCCDYILAQYGGVSTPTLMSQNQYVCLFGETDTNGSNVYVGQGTTGSVAAGNYSPVMTKPGSDEQGAGIEVFAKNSGFMNLAQNPEAIMGYTNNMSQAVKARFSWMNIFNGGIPARIDDRLYNLMDNSDYRKMNFIQPAMGDFTVDNAVKLVINIPSYTNVKFAFTKGMAYTATNPNAGNGDSYYARLSEVLLWKAEAQARAALGHASYTGTGLGDAKATLDILLAARTVTGDTPLTCATYSSMSGMTDLQMVQLQSRIELWGEQGYEFFNNKRWGIPVNRSGSAVHHAMGSLSVANMTIMIPFNEMSTNPLAVQNGGQN